MHYFIGDDPSAWHTHVPTFDSVSYRVAKNVDVVFYGKGRELEYDFVVHPGGNVADATLRIEGARLSIEGSSLVAELDDHALRQLPPEIRQIDGEGHVRSVRGTYRVAGDTLGFEVAAYAPDQDLVIDPSLYSTFLGGSQNDSVAAVANAGSEAFVAGKTASTDFPTKNAYQGSNGGNDDAFVARIDQNGALLWATYLGGSQSDGVRAVMNHNGNAVYLVGSTTSSNFPTVNPVQGSATANGDAFFAFLSGDGSSFAVSTYLGGNDFDEGVGFAVDHNFHNVVIGDTKSTNFPIANAVQNTNAGGLDLFVTAYDFNITTIKYSTYFGGTGDDVAGGVGSVGSAAYITGRTASANFR